MDIEVGRRVSPFSVLQAGPPFISREEEKYMEDKVGASKMIKVASLLSSFLLFYFMESFY